MGTSPSSTRCAIPTACRTSYCSIPAAIVGGRNRTRRSLLAERGYSPKKVELVRRWFNGEFAPHEMLPILMRIGPPYSHHPSLRLALRDLIRGEWRSKLRPEALIFAGRHLAKGWTVMDRLGEIEVPTLVMAGRDDFVFPPEHQPELAARHPQRPPPDNRTCWPQPALGAARRGDGGGQGLHLRSGAAVPRSGSRRHLRTTDHLVELGI